MYVKFVFFCINDRSLIIKSKNANNYIKAIADCLMEFLLIYSLYYHLFFINDIVSNKKIFLLNLVSRIKSFFAQYTSF